MHGSSIGKEERGPKRRPFAVEISQLFGRFLEVAIEEAIVFRSCSKETASSILQGLGALGSSLIVIFVCFPRENATLSASFSVSCVRACAYSDFVSKLYLGRPTFTFGACLVTLRLLEIVLLRGYEQMNDKLLTAIFLTIDMVNTVACAN